MNENKTVVVFDDDEDILLLCSVLLKRSGWTVHTFPNVIDVVEQCRNITPDVIIMDNWIPEAGGVTATRALKNDPATREIPIVYFTANRYAEQLAEEAGANDWLAKPFDNSALIAKLDKAICNDL